MRSKCSHCQKQRTVRFYAGSRFLLCATCAQPLISRTLTAIHGDGRNGHKVQPSVTPWIDDEWVDVQ